METLHPGSGNFSSTRELTVDDDGLGIIDEDAITVFTRGQCHNLACAIARAVPEARVELACYGRGDDVNPDYYWDHALALMPDGRYLDINGPTENGNYLCGSSMVPYTEEEIRAARGGTGLGYPMTPGIAEPFVRALLAEHYPELVS